MCLNAGVQLRRHRGGTLPPARGAVRLRQLQRFVRWRALAFNRYCCPSRAEQRDEHPGGHRARDG